MDLSSLLADALRGVESSTERLDAQPTPPFRERVKRRVKQYIPKFQDGLLTSRRLSDHRNKGRHLLSSSGKDMTRAMGDVLPKRSKQRLEARTEVAKWPVSNESLKDEQDQDLVTSPYSSTSSELCGVGSLFPPPYQELGDVRASLVSLGSTPEVDSPGNDLNLYSSDNEDDSRHSSGSHSDQVSNRNRPFTRQSSNSKLIDPVRRVSTVSTWGTNGSDVTTLRNSRDSVDISRHSVFSHPTSVASSQSSLGEVVQTAVLHSARCGPPRVKGVAPPSSLNNELIPDPEAALAESVAGIPNVMPLRSSLHKPPFLDQQASKDIAEASWAAHPRRNNKRPSPGFGEEGGDKKRAPMDQSLLEPRSDRGSKGDVDPTSDALSTIDEGHSDGGCSTQSATIPAGSAEGNAVTDLAQWVPNPSITVTSGSITGHHSPSSEHSKQPDTTPGTSILERPDQDDSDMPGMSDDEEGDDDGYSSDSVSEFTEDTEDSLCRSLAGISIEPKLTSLALTLQDQIIFIVVQRVLSWIRSHSPGDDPGDSQSANSGTPADFNPSQYNGEGSGQGSGGNSGGKRDFDGRDTGGTGRGNGDDGHKRRRTDAHTLDKDKNKIFACPFAKRYPEMGWPSTCNRGWAQVHRVKEHLYKKHMVRTHCYRCFATFKNEEELEHHARQEPQCEKCDKPAEQMIGVTKIAKEKLKARTSLSALSDVDKWKHIYGIVFPEVKSEDVPSPYFDMAPLVSSMSAQELARYRLIIQGRIPRVVGGIQEGLSSRPECSGISVRALSDVIHNQVWDAFDQFFERFFPATVAPVERRNLGGRCSQCGCVDSPQMQLETPAVDIAANQPAGSIRTEMVPVNTEAGGPMELTHDMDSEGSNSMEGHNLFDNPLDEETVGFSGNDAAIGNIADLIFSEEMTRLIQDGNFQGV